MSKNIRLNNLSFIGLIIAAFSIFGLSSCTVEDQPYQKFDPSETALHHIADANAFHIFGDYYLPLPCMLYARDAGWTFLSSSAKFHIGHHGNGELAIDRYVLHHGMVKRIADSSFPMGTVQLDGGHGHGHGGKGHHNESPSHKGHDGHDHKHDGHDHKHDHNHDGHNHGDHKGHDHGSIDLQENAQAVLVSEKGGNDGHSGGHADVVSYKGKTYALEDKTTWDFGLAGGGSTSFFDFSLTKNVFTLLLVAFLMGGIFISCAKAYKRREGQAPSGLQSLMEPLFVFIRDDVAKPMIGEKKYRKFMPYLMAVFFFILGLNLVGQIPFFPGSGNASGNISVTIVLALFTFFITNLNGNAHYWKHVLWMPGIPAAVKTILTPVEFMGLFLKPFTLMVRLFANISAGHIVVISFVGLIFILGDSGRSLGGATVGLFASFLLTMFMMAIELLVAFIQAFIFTILSASYIGSAVEEGHDDHH